MAKGSLMDLAEDVGTLEETRHDEQYGRGPGDDELGQYDNPLAPVGDNDLYTRI